MGAYDNPTLIQDMSGAKAWADASTLLSSTIATGMGSLAEAIKKQREAADEAADIWSLAYNESSLFEHRQFNTVMDEYSAKETDKNLIDEVMTIGTQLLEGYEGRMGAIEAKTLLATKSDLTKDQRKQYQRVINESDQYQRNIKRAAGIVAGDVDVITKLNPETIKDHYWQGDTMEDKVISMFTGNRLAGFGFNDVTFETDLKREERASGIYSNILSVKTKIKRDNKLIKNIAAFQDENKYKVDENGYITLEWKRDLNKWDGGLLEELIAVTDYDKIQKQTNITKANGDLSKGLEVNLGIDFEYLDNGKMRSIESIWLNKNKMESAFSNSVDLDGRIAELMTLGPGHLQAYIEQRLKMGAEFDIHKFLKQSPKDQEKDLRLMELEAYKEEVGINLGSKKIPGFDLEKKKLTANDLANLREQGIKTDKLGLIAWEKGMTEEMNPNAYGFFYINRSGDQSDPTYVKEGFVEKTNKASLAKWNKAMPTNGWEVNTIFYGKIMPGEAKLSRRIIWDNVAKVWKPQVFVPSMGTFMGDAQLVKGLVPSANKAVFRNFLNFPVAEK